MMPKTPRDPPPSRDAAHLETAPGHAPAVPPNYNFILWAPKITALLCFHFVTTSKPKPPSKTRTLIPKP